MRFCVKSWGARRRPTCHSLYGDELRAVDNVAEFGAVTAAAVVVFLVGRGEEFVEIAVSVIHLGRVGEVERSELGNVGFVLGNPGALGGLLGIHVIAELSAVGIGVAAVLISAIGANIFHGFFEPTFAISLEGVIAGIDENVGGGLDFGVGVAGAEIVDGDDVGVPGLVEFELRVQLLAVRNDSSVFFLKLVESGFDGGILADAGGLFEFGDFVVDTGGVVFAGFDVFVVVALAGPVGVDIADDAFAIIGGIEFGDVIFEVFGLAISFAVVDVADDSDDDADNDNSDEGSNANNDTEDDFFLGRRIHGLFRLRSDWSGGSRLSLRASGGFESGSW